MHEISIFLLKPKYDAWNFYFFIETETWCMKFPFLLKKIFSISRAVMFIWFHYTINIILNILILRKR